MQRIPILRMGEFLLVTIQVDMHDRLATKLSEDLSTRIAATRARGVLIDISALDMVDSFIARKLGDIAQISRVLDAETVLVGMQPAVAMAHRSGLENRVRAMLDQARSHLPLTPRVAGGMLVASVAMLLLLAPIRLGAIAPVLVDANAADDTAAVAKSSKVEPNADETYVFTGTVVHPDGTPSAGASLHGRVCR